MTALLTDAAPAVAPPSSPPALDPIGARRLARALDAILADLASWDQEVWGVRDACGTRLCLAGHLTVTVAGYAPAWRRFPTHVTHRTAACEVIWSVHVPDPTDPTRSLRQLVDVAAAGYLGLLDARGRVDDHASALFWGGRSLRRLVELAYLYSGGAVDRFAAYDRLPADVRATDAAREVEDGVRLAGDVASLRPVAPFELDAARWVELLGVC